MTSPPVSPPSFSGRLRGSGPLCCASILLVLAGLPGCGGGDPKAGGGAGRPGAAAIEPVEHDFGTIPHREQREARLILPVPAVGGPWTPVGFNRSCTCAQYAFVARGTDGVERVVAGDGRPDPVGALGAGETLVLRLTIDTREKEAADLPAAWTPGQVILQGPPPQFTRATVPVRFRFGIEAPFELTPSAHLALGDLPRPIRYEQSMQIHRRGRAIQLGKPDVIELGPTGVLQHPVDVEVSLDAEPEPAILTVAVRPSESRPDGPLRCEVRIPTDLPDGYELRIPISGSVVGAIVIEPPSVFSFGRIPMDAEREMRLRLIDHDLARSADFVVLGVVADDGRDLAGDFDVVLERIEGRPRDRIVSFRYLGKLQATSFRGEVLLGKEADQPPLVRLPFVGFSKL